MALIPCDAGGGSLHARVRIVDQALALDKIRESSRASGAAALTRDPFQNDAELVGHASIRAWPSTGQEWVPGLRFASPGTTTHYDAAMWVYLLASKRGGTLYVGVTRSLSRRMAEHRDDRGSEFIRQYGVKRLVYAERFDDPREAIAQEKRIKHWRRCWKIELIERSNPDWNDLYPTIHLD